VAEIVNVKIVTSVTYKRGAFNRERERERVGVGGGLSSNIRISLQYSLYVLKMVASFCYCAYVLRIPGYSGFLRNLPTNTTIFLHGLRLCGKSRS